MARTPIHPGEILREELAEMGVNAAELARQINVPNNRLYQILDGRRAITADTALRLGKWFGMSAEFWLNLQKSFELRSAAQAIAKEIEAIPTRGNSPAGSQIDGAA
jgi:addiction module HigA family antidote